MTDCKKAIFVREYYLGQNAFQELPRLQEEYGGRGFFLVCRHLAQRVQSIAQNASCSLVFHEECTPKAIAKIQAAVQKAQATVIFAVGGGKVIDAAKFVATALELPFITVPTSAATNACSTRSTVLYTEDGVYDHSFYSPKNPDVVVVDSSIMAKAPARFLASGMGDALAAYYEGLTCLKGGYENIGHGQQPYFAKELGKICDATLKKYGRAALQAVKEQKVTAALERILEAITLYSAIVYEASGTAGAHSIHNGMTIFPQTHALLHGEKVAFGVLASLFCNEEIPACEIEEVCSLCYDLGLPITFADLGLANLSQEDLYTWSVAITKTPRGFKEKNGLDPATYQNALLQANALGEAWQAKMKKKEEGYE